MRHTTRKSPCKFLTEQECIRVGCVPSAAVAVGGGGSLGGVCPEGGCLPGWVFPEGEGVSAPVHAGIHPPP